MKTLLFIMMSFNVAAQQLVTLCNGQSQTYFYSADANLPGDTEWDVNGITYTGNPVGLTWSDTGIYVLTATHWSLDCPSEPVTYTVTVKECEQLIYYIPNSFTPDGNEYNQTWGPVFTAGFDPYDFHLLVFDRWGETIWESWDVTTQWDGSYNGAPVQDGTYTWVIWFGDKYTDARYTKNGHVTILK
jgi:gliding motility-associated-like protein